MDDRVATFDFDAMRERRPERKKYWNGVIAHEREHQHEQSARFNLGEITFGEESIPVVPDLVEWQAIREAQQPQPDSDLTPEYQEFARRGDQLVAFLGSKEPLLKALKSGDMLALQEEIVRREMEAVYKRLGQMTMN